MGDRAKVRQDNPVTLPNDSEPEPDIGIGQRLGREYRSHHPYSENIFWWIEYAESGACHFCPHPKSLSQVGLLCTDISVKPKV
ncbi:MAG: hypothetical protein OHK0047_36080 [Leptolyngbyaceae cyanobacterium]